MARIFEPSAEQEASYHRWAEALPEPARSNALKFLPWELYVLGNGSFDGASRVTINGYNDDGTMSVIISAKYNMALHERIVFGVPPSNLSPCELPPKGEPLGSLMSHEDVVDNIDALRVMIRPDLWVMGVDGKAHPRKPH